MASVQTNRSTIIEEKKFLVLRQHESHFPAMAAARQRKRYRRPKNKHTMAIPAATKATHQRAIGLCTSKCIEYYTISSTREEDLHVCGGRGAPPPLAFDRSTKETNILNGFDATFLAPPNT
jgi:hypothetical protein